MSNQVFSNSVGRFFPNAGQWDKLTLYKNSGVLGYTNKTSVGVAGIDLFWSSLNGTKLTDATSFINSQNVPTKPYWIIASGGTALSGATTLVSLVDNLISVNAVIPFWLQKGSVINGGFVRFAACVLDPNNNYTVLSTTGLTSSSPISTSTISVGTLVTPCPGGESISCVVEVKAGQVLTIRAYFIYPADYTQTATIVIQDDAMNTTPTALVTECSLTFQKL